MGQGSTGASTAPADTQCVYILAPSAVLLLSVWGILGQSIPSLCCPCSVPSCSQPGPLCFLCHCLSTPPFPGICCYGALPGQFLGLCEQVCLPQRATPDAQIGQRCVGIVDGMDVAARQVSQGACYLLGVPLLLLLLSFLPPFARQADEIRTS